MREQDRQLQFAFSKGGRGTRQVQPMGACALQGTLPPRERGPAVKGESFLDTLERLKILECEEHGLLVNDPLAKELESPLRALISEIISVRPRWIPAAEVDGLALDPPPGLTKEICLRVLSLARTHGALEELAGDRPGPLWNIEFRGARSQITGLMLFLRYLHAEERLNTGRPLSLAESLVNTSDTLVERCRQFIERTEPRVRRGSAATYVPEIDYFDDRFHPLFRSENHRAVFQGIERLRARPVLWLEGYATAVRGSTGREIRAEDLLRGYRDAFGIPNDNTQVARHYERSARDADVVLAHLSFRESWPFEALLSVLNTAYEKLERGSADRPSLFEMYCLLFEDREGERVHGMALMMRYNESLRWLKDMNNLDAMPGNPLITDAWRHFKAIRGHQGLPSATTLESLTKSALYSPSPVPPSVFEAALDEIRERCFGGKVGAMLHQAVASRAFGVGWLHTVKGLEILRAYSLSRFHAVNPGLTLESAKILTLPEFTPAASLRFYRESRGAASKSREQPAESNVAALIELLDGC